MHASKTTLVTRFFEGPLVCPFQMAVAAVKLWEIWEGVMRLVKPLNYYPRIFLYGEECWVEGGLSFGSVATR